MALPGKYFYERETTTPRSAPTDTGVAYAVGLTEKGPASVPVRVTSIADYRRRFGGHVAFGDLPTWVEVALCSGVSRVYVLRLVGPSATAASVRLVDSDSRDVMTVSAVDPGSHANGQTVDVVVDRDGGFYLTVSAADGTTLAASPLLADNTAAAEWAENTGIITIQVLDDAAPRATSGARLDSGDDDRANVTDDVKIAALDLIPRALGPGQLAVPGASSARVHQAMLEHCRDRNRRALLDHPASTDPATIITALRAARSLGELARYGAFFGPRAIVPGVVPNTTRTVPYSAIVAGHCARVDATYGHPNVAAAGKLGRASYALGLEVEFTDAEWEQLHDAGMNVARTVNGEVRTYGFRTVVDPEQYPLHWQFANVRLDMAIAARADVVQEDAVFVTIDGEGIELAAYGGRLMAMLDELYAARALYGETADDARSVDVGPSVNTPESIAEGRIRAVMAYRRSPMAERVEVERVVVATTESV